MLWSSHNVRSMYSKTSKNTNRESPSSNPPLRMSRHVVAPCIKKMGCWKTRINNFWPWCRICPYRSYFFSRRLTPWQLFPAPPWRHQHRPRPWLRSQPNRPPPRQLQQQVTYWFHIFSSSLHKPVASSFLYKPVLRCKIFFFKIIIWELQLFFLQYWSLRQFRSPAHQLQHQISNLLHKTVVFWSFVLKYKL